MRLLNLHLERYGPFTDRRLALPPDAKLHIVHGRNEAGKSCSLAAITDLFFGIEHRTRYDFLHAGKELRVGAEIMARNGDRLAFKRRKGNKNTLLDADEAALDDDALAPFLGGLSREVFRRAFGLDAEGLRSGAEELVRTGGEVGASLFAAASGLRGLTQLRQTLDEEAGRIFAPRASKDRLFYQALERHEEARRAIRERELRSGTWQELNERIAGLTARLDEIKAARAVKATERARLLRLKRVAPLVRNIDEEVARLAAFDALPDLPPGFRERLLALSTAASEAHEAQQAAAARAAEIAGEQAGIHVDEALLAAAGEIQALFGETGAYANDRRDLPRIQAERSSFDATLTAFAVRLGLADAAAVEAAQPTDAAQAVVRALISEGRAVRDALDQVERTLVQERRALTELEMRARVAAGQDPAPLWEALGALVPLVRRSERLTGTAQAIAAEERSLAEGAGRLSPSVASLDELAAVPLPALETVARFRTEFDRLDGDLRRFRDRLDAARDAVLAAEARLLDLAGSRPVPSPEAVLVERAERDAAWRSLRAALFSEPGAPTGLPLAEAVARFERHREAADRLADECAADAERVAAHVTEMRRLADARMRQAEVEARLAAVEAEKAELVGRWNAAWHPAGIEPHPPADMTTWLARAGELIDRREALERERAAYAAAADELRTLMPALAALAVQAGLPPLEGIDSAGLVARVEARLRALDEQWKQDRIAESRISDGRLRIAGLTADAAEARSRLDAWSERWQAALSAVGLPASTTHEGAEAALQTWKDVPAVLRERQNRAARVAGMQRNVDGFQARAGDLVARLAPDLAALPADLAVRTLNDRLAAAVSDESRRRDGARRLADAERLNSQALAAAEAALADIAALTARLPTDIPVQALLAGLTERDTRRRALDARRAELVVQADGVDEITIRRELETFDPDEAEAQLSALDQEDEELDQQGKEAFAGREQALRERTALEQGMGAEVALQQRRNAEAELVARSREWLVLKVGALLLDKAVERHRAGQQDPLLMRAGALFRTLTGEAFHGLGRSFDEADVPHLTGLRANGESVAVIGMSEGTRDQLYLALRLAYLESYAERAEPAPFIADDLFATFDEERTAHGLAALTAIGDRVQPIVFTHHRHVVDIARTHVGPDVHIMELG